MPYLIWDFDNTLAYRPGLWSQCLADVANAAMPPAQVSREQLAPHLSSGFPWHSPDHEHPHLSSAEAWWNNLYPVLSAALVAACNMNASAAASIAVRARTEYLNPTRWRVFPDTEPSLRVLGQRGWRHVVLSNHVPELPELIAGLGLAPHFQRVFSSAAVGYEKPHPAAFMAAIEAIPRGKRIVMVGDSFVADYQGARKIGLPAVLVRNTHPGCPAVPDLHALVHHLQ